MLDETIMALSRNFSSSSKSLDSPQEQPTFQPNRVNVLAISSNPCCEHSNVLEEDMYLLSELEVRRALSEASNNEVELVMLSMFVEVVKHLVLKQCMVIQQKVTSVSGGGCGGTSDQGGISARAVGVSASKSSMLCYTIKCHAGAYSNCAMHHSYNLYAISFGPFLIMSLGYLWVTMTTCTNMRELIVIQWVSISKY